MLYFEPLKFLFVHACVSIGICLVILFAVYVINSPKPNSEKNMAYECGFKPFDFAYYPFDVQFYRVGILFLLFDVEIMFFFPWVLNFYQITIVGHFIMLVFIGLLLLGFLYEVNTGVLAWYPKTWQTGKTVLKND